MKSAHLVAISPELIGIGFPNNSKKLEVLLIYFYVDVRVITFS